jgi:putative transposase
VRFLEIDIEMYSQVKQDVPKRLGRAMDAFFRRVANGETAGYPRFQGRNRYNSFTYTQASNGSVKFVDGKLVLSKIGAIKIKLHREIEGKIKTCTIKREGNEWYAIFSVDIGKAPKKSEPQSSIGVDVGLKSIITLSNGENVEPPKYYREAEKKLAVQQRKLSKKKKFSNNWRKQCAKISKLHRNVANQRKDFNHKLSRDLVDTYDLVVFEDLEIKNMVKNKHLSKSIHDASWGKLIQMTEYKAEEAGKHVDLVNPYNTSQLCSTCGNKVKKDLSVRIHTCPHCGLVLDRDVNAAINILNLSTVGTTERACGVTSVGTNHEAGSHRF